MPAPLFVLPNGGGWAYGGSHLDKTSLDYLSHSLPELTDALTRGSAWVTLWARNLVLQRQKLDGGRRFARRLVARGRKVREDHAARLQAGA